MWKIVAAVCLGIVLILATGVGIIFAAYPLRYGDDIRAASVEFGIEADLIASIIRAESGFDRRARSNKGAVGLMQLLPSTAEWISKESDLDLMDPETNIRVGTMYFRYLMDRFGDVRTALMAYNAGPNKVAGWLKQKGLTTLETSPYPATNAYVDRVMGARWIYRIRL